jgi:hypothetical protein
MSFPEKRENLFGQKKNAGGTQKVPPTPCLRSAYTSAHAAPALHAQNGVRALLQDAQALWLKASKTGLFFDGGQSHEHRRNLALRPRTTPDGNASGFLRHLGARYADRFIRSFDGFRTGPMIAFN